MPPKLRGATGGEPEVEDIPDTPESPAETALDRMLQQFAQMKVQLQTVIEKNNRVEEELRIIKLSYVPPSMPRNNSEEDARSMQTVIHHEEDPESPLQTHPPLPPPVSAGMEKSVILVESRENIPFFEAKSPASLPLKRNYEVDFWLRQIELRARPADDAGRIRAARATCRGNAEPIINSFLFDGIHEWSEFKRLVKKKFRGTASAAEFLNLLRTKRLLEHQSPQDLYLEVEGAVLSGIRDYPSVLGDQEELTKRTFLQGLPHWLQEAVAVREQDQVDDLVSAAQRVWAARLNSRPTGNTRYSSVTYPRYHQPPHEVVAAAGSQEEPYCAFHRRRGHNTFSCRTKPRGRVCWECHRDGHMRQNCPFQTRQPGSAPPRSDSSSTGVSPAD